MLRRFPWLLTALVLPLVGVLVALGVWQVERLRWKEGLIDAAAAAQGRPPAPLAEVLAGGAPEFRRVIVACPGLATAPFVELQSILDGEAGVRLVSACRPAGEAFTLLVDRGFIADGVTTRPRVLASTLPGVIVGELRTPPEPAALAPPPANGRFYTRDGPAMARALGVQGALRPEVAFAVSTANPETPALRPSAPPPAFSNNHLGYALTWFGLAVALVGFYAALLRRRLKKDLP